MKGNGWRQAARVSTVLLACGCERKSDEASGKASSASVATARDAPVENLAASAASSGTSRQLASCEYRVRDLTFTDCNPKPTQTDYPECTNYGIGPLTDAADHGCIPGGVRLAVSGYPGRLDVLFVSTKLLEGGEVEVRLEEVHQSTAESLWTRGAVLGRLELVEGRVKGFSLQGELRERSRVPRLVCPGVEGSDAGCQLERGSK